MDLYKPPPTAAQIVAPKAVASEVSEVTTLTPKTSENYINRNNQKIKR